MSQSPWKLPVSQWYTAQNQTKQNQKNITLILKSKKLYATKITLLHVKAHSEQSKIVRMQFKTGG